MKKMKFLLATIVVVGISNVALAQWSLTGNASTTPGTNYVGTSDSKDLVLKTGNSEAIRIGSGSYVGSVALGAIPTAYTRFSVTTGLPLNGIGDILGEFRTNYPMGAGFSSTKFNDYRSGQGYYMRITDYLSSTGVTKDMFSISVIGKTVIGNSGSTGNMLSAYGGTSIGASYGGISAPSNGLIVQGNTGIGTSTVVNTLDVEGGMVVGASYSGTNTAPTNGLLVEGNLGVGLTAIPSGGPTGGYKMAVSGNTNFIGGVVIGTTANFTAGTPFPTTYKLFVEGGIITEKLKVSPKSTADWSDYVFEKNYKLRSLSEVEKYVTENKHLPGVPSAQEVVDNGIDVAKMDAKLLEKIEELTLYMLQQQKQLESQQKQIEELKGMLKK